MATDFKCPHCSNLLNVGENIVFTARNRFGKEGLIMLTPQIGDYTVIKHPNFDIHKGEKVDFYCLYCNTQLVSERNPNLAKILMSDEKGIEYEILFSRIVGEHATYRIVGKTVDIYGEDAAEYLDSINNPDQ